jgi:acylaminoacyl-peptidase
MDLSPSKPEALYADLAAIPTLTAGFLLSKGTTGGLPHVMLRRNQKDLNNDEARSHLLQFSPGGDQFVAQPFPSELRDVSAMAPSPSGDLLALVRSRTVNGKKEQSIEIWNADMLITTVKPNSDQHGDLYVGDVFSAFEWSPDSSKLLYVAEAPTAKAVSFWRDASAADKGVGKEHEYKDDWGELSTGRRLSRLFVLHLPSKTVKPVEGVPQHLAAGQVCICCVRVCVCACVRVKCTLCACTSCKIHTYS